MSEDTMRIDRHMPGTRLYRLVTQKVTEILNAMPDASGRRDLRGVQIRAFRRSEGVPRGPLQARAHRQGRAGRHGDGGAEARGGRQVPARGVDEARPTSCPSSPPSTAGGSARTT